MEMTVRQMLGQKLIFGFHGTALNEEFKDLIREYKIGNVILFLRNVESAAQLRRLCAEIQSLILEVTGYPAFIVIDQEGGMVTRLPVDAVTVPCAMAISATDDPENARIAAEITIRQLRGLGANFNMAPVLDVNSNPANPVIGVRSVGDDPHRAADYGEAAVRAYANTGVFCCGKHFPGHGDTNVDSHLGLPRIEKTVEELEETELIPFRRCIDAGIPAIMSSHILFPNIEKENIPGTMSRTIITDLLKKRLGFRGLVFSDCLEMAAIQKYYGTARGTVAAIKAGIDLAEISSTIGLMWDAARAVNEAAEQGEFDMEEIRESVEKILAVKRALAVTPDPGLCNRQEDRDTVQAMIRSAVTGCGGQPPVPGKNTFFCGCSDYRASLVGNPDAGMLPFPEHMANAFGGAAAVTSKDPGEEEIRAVAAQAAGYEQIVLGTCNAHLFRGQLALAEALAATGKPLTVVTLRNPYDIPLLPDCVCKIAAYDYSTACFRALEEVFRGGAMTGVLPVTLRRETMFVAGIDGGGTHTRIELRDMDNRLLRHGEFGPFNLNSIGEDAYRALLREVFAWCGDMAACARLCVGAAGISNPKVGRILAEELERAGFRGSYKLCGDQEIALRGAMDGPGVAVIAGTGSICFGKNAAGETARSGGYGHIIDDGGSGYALGRDVLSAAVRAVDGRIGHTGILQPVLDRLGGGPEKIVPFVYDPKTDKSAIAQLAFIALEQAELGDAEALNILNREALELAQLVAAAQKRLDLPRCRIALLGGLLSSDNPYRRVVTERLSELGQVIIPAHNALWGAAQMAWEMDN